MWRVRQFYDPLYCLTVMLLHFAAAWLLMVLVVGENSRRRDKTASLLSGVANGAAGRSRRLCPRQRREGRLVVRSASLLLHILTGSV